jgi:type II secretory pathway component PulC
MIVSLPRSPWFYRCLNGALALLLAWVAAGLLWQWFAPASRPPVAAPPRLASTGPQLDVAPLTNVFGAVAPGGADAPSTLNYKLRGVIAAQADAPAAALFDAGGQPTLAVRSGEELESGVRLVEVAGDHVVVDNHGRRERLDLDSKPAAGGISPAGQPPVAEPSGLISPVPPAPAMASPASNPTPPAPANAPPVSANDAVPSALNDQFGTPAMAQLAGNPFTSYYRTDNQAQS